MSMSAPFASVSDLKNRWPGLPEEDEGTAAQMLDDASLVIRSRYKDIDARIARGDLDSEMAGYVVCMMVKRAMDVPEEVPDNATQLSFTAGPFTQSTTFRNTDGALYLSKQELKMLAPDDQSETFFNLMPR